jgi:hypothetical protein
MKLYLKDQADRFHELLTDLIRKPTTSFDKNRLTEKVSTIDIVSIKPLKETNIDFLFDYQIFPSDIMTFKTQWDYENRKMKIGDTILQQATIPPSRVLSQKIIFGVRINNIIDEDERRGFSYETIEGHVEKGESTFTVEQSERGLVFRIKTFSEPGNLLTKLVGPIFTVPYQAYCTRKALENVKKQILQGGNSAQQ